MTISQGQKWWSDQPTLRPWLLLETAAAIIKRLKFGNCPSASGGLMQPTMQPNWTPLNSYQPIEGQIEEPRVDVDRFSNQFCPFLDCVQRVLQLADPVLLLTALALPALWYPKKCCAFADIVRPARVDHERSPSKYTSPEERTPFGRPLTPR